MKNIFRSVEFWKTSLMTLPDNAFFELLRTVFGKIKTPFSKQLLIADLEKFLLRNDIQKNIAAFIDSNDIRIITAVAILNEPDSKTLESFFSGEMSSAMLNDLLVNLEERFILYRFLDKGKMCLALNPVFMQILEPLLSDTSVLFPSFAAGDVPLPQQDYSPVLYQFDDRILAALFSFISHNETFYNTGGDIRKKILNASNIIFPGLTLETTVGSLTALGLFIQKNDRLVPDYRHLRTFGSLSRMERMEYCAAAMYCYQDYLTREKSAAGISPWLFRSKIGNCANFIHHFLSSLEQGRLYPVTTLHRLGFLTENEFAFSGKLLDAMKQAGLLILIANQYWQKPFEEENSVQDTEKGLVSRAAIATDSPFTILLYREIGYNDAMDIAAVSLVIEAGLNVRFEINRDSAVAAFDRGITAEKIIELLQRLSQNRIDNNVIFTLRDWEKSHQEVALRKGLILTLSPERRYLAETKPLADLITETLAPGIYILPETAEDRVSRALGKAGVTIIARLGDTREETAVNAFLSASHNFFPHLYSQTAPAEKNFTAPDKENTMPANPAAPDLKQDFYSILKRMNIGTEERNELSARIDRRLVLCESQLKDALVRYEKLEARGLDYAGKALIAKQAIAMQSQVEAVCPGRQESVYGIPKALEKTGGESVLVIETAEGDSPVRIPLGKISLLRRIKKSIFESAIN